MATPQQRKHPALFEMAASVPLTPEASASSDFASAVLRAFSGASWNCPAFLSELAESGLVEALYQAHAPLKAASQGYRQIQDLTDLEEAMRKLRHELALAEKRLPGGGSSSAYPSWPCVGHVCALMLQAITCAAAAAMASASTATAAAAAALQPQQPPGSAGAHSPDPPGPASASPQTPVGNAQPGPLAELSERTPSSGPGAEPVPQTPAAYLRHAVASGSGASTPGGALGKASGSGMGSPGGIGGGSLPAIATEAGLLRLLSNKHAVARSADVVRGVPLAQRPGVGRVLLRQLAKDMQATLAGVAHMCSVLKGDPEATTPVSSSLPKAWLGTATAYSELFKEHGSAGDEAATLVQRLHANGTCAAATGAASDAPSTPCGSYPNGHGGSASPATTSPQTSPTSNSHAPAPQSGASGRAQPEGAQAAAAPSAAGAGTHPSSAAPAPALAPRCPSSPALPGEDDDPRALVTRAVADMASALSEAVQGAHAVGRIAVLLRGEATAKFTTVASYMPSALTINELMLLLDGLSVVASALGAMGALRRPVEELLGSAAVRDLLGAGKVYVTTVVAAGALTRDLGIEAAIPASLRQGYMAAVLTPLETGALLNERRAPQVLAYRGSITESSYYQVMDVDALPYGVHVRFEDEQEAEGMGVVREWLSQIAADLFSMERGLFLRGAEDRRVVHPAPHSHMQDDHLGYMRFAGRIVGLALRANVPLGVVLSTGLFAYLTGRRATLKDLRQIDPQVATTCTNILAAPHAEALDLAHVWHGLGGDEELLPGGAALPVTDANKAAYVELLAHHVVIVTVEKQAAAFLAGLQDTAHHLPEEPRLRRAFLTPLALEDLNRITAGEEALDPADWAAHTDVAGFDSPEEKECVTMFWSLVVEYGQEDRQRLLQFWTAMTHLPSGGFKAINQRLQILKMGPPAERPAGAAATPAAAAAPAPAPAAATPSTPAPAQQPHAADARGPSTDGTGPHSHRLDGDALELEEQEQEPGEGLSYDGGHAGEAGRAPPGEQAAPHSSGEPGAGATHAAPAAEHDLPRAGGSGGGAAAGGSSASAGPGTPAPDGEPGGAAGEDGGEALPYEDGLEGTADEDYEEGEEAEEEDMEGGLLNEDDEEFERQLALALALSLEEPPAPAPGADGGASGAAGSGAASGSDGAAAPPSAASAGSAAAPAAAGPDANAAPRQEGGLPAAGAASADAANTAPAHEGGANLQAAAPTPAPASPEPMTPAHPTSSSAAAEEAAAAAAPSASATPPATTCCTLQLPQARTCFLQLNLPVYSKLDDMRRAFHIACANMSFGLH